MNPVTGNQSRMRWAEILIEDEDDDEDEYDEARRERHLPALAKPC